MVKNPAGESRTASPQAVFDGDMTILFPSCSLRRAVLIEPDDSSISIVFNSAPLA
ncbi:MAG: hypothetical protein ACTSP0_06320 [Alphaproteobacteria bacterium]